MSGWNIIYGLINFAILAVGLLLVGRKLVVNMLRGHREGVEKALSDSEAAARQAEKLREELPEHQTAGEKAREEILEQARTQAEKTLEAASQADAGQLRDLEEERRRTSKLFARQLRRENNDRAAKALSEGAAAILGAPENADACRELTERFVAKMERELTLSSADLAALEEKGSLPCRLTWAEEPSKQLQERAEALLQRVTGNRAQLTSALAGELVGGLVLQVGDTVHDGSLKSLLTRAEKRLAEADNTGEDLIEALNRELDSLDREPETYQTGAVVSVSDGICRVSGLSDAMAGELLDFGGGLRGMVMDLEKDNVGVVLLGSYDSLQEGAKVRRTGRIIEVPVGEELIGRVIST